MNFGEDVLGGSFRAHHGNWHADSTRGIIVAGAEQHPVLRGVDDIWGPSDVYRTYAKDASLPEACTPLLVGQPLVGRSYDDEPNTGKGSAADRVDEDLDRQRRQDGACLPYDDG